jgi:hypothetical protein
MVSATKQEDGQPAIKASGRSSSYPWIDLGVAVGRLEELWKAVKTYEVPVKAAYKTWGYAEKSSGARLTLAALLNYGLLLDKGANEQRTVKISPLGVEIMMAPNTTSREAALKTAALKPKIFYDLIKDMDPENPVSDQVIAHMLVAQRGFNPNSTETFLKSFSGTLKYAKLRKSDIVSGSENDSDVAMQTKTETVITPDSGMMTLSGSRPILQRTGIKTDVHNFADGGQVVLQWPEGITAEDFEEFEEWIELQKKKIKKVATKVREQQ